MTIGNQAANDVDKTIRRAAVTRMLNLRDVLELVNDGLNNRTLTREQLVTQPHEMVLHIAPRFGKELNIKSFKQMLGELGADVASVGKDFATQVSQQVADGFTVVGIARSQGDIEQFAAFAHDQMKFEAIEPVQGGFAASRHTIKHFVLRDAAVVTNLQTGGINEADARALTETTFQVAAQR